MPGAKGMILAVLHTLMAGKVYDATPTRDGNHGQETKEEGAEEELEVKLETAHWTNDNDHGTIGRGTGNDFGLTTSHAAPSGTGVTHTTPVSETAPYVSTVHLSYDKYFIQWTHM